MSMPIEPTPASSALDVVTFGEAMLLLVADRPGPLEDAGAFHKRTAGAETNVAIGLARLGLKVGWASRLGTDMMGRYLIKAMASEGIDCSHVICDPTQKTGFQFKGRVLDGSDPPVEYHRQGSAASHMGCKTSTRPGCCRRGICTRPACLPRCRPAPCPPRAAPWT